MENQKTPKKIKPFDAGPEYSSILDNLHVLQQHLEEAGDQGISLLKLLQAFKKVKTDVFGNHVGELWQERLAEFNANLIEAHENAHLPISPKMHILAKHVHQFVIMNNGQGLGRLNEAAVEAVHGTFLKIWGLYEVSDEQSVAYLEHLLKAVIQTNANNT